MITLGLTEIQVGTASTSGEMPVSLAKLGKTYKESCNVKQDTADVTEHYEEGKASPEVRSKSKKVPKISFSIMDPDVDMLVAYIGGVKIGTKWGFDGTEIVANKAISLIPEVGLVFDIPNGDIEATINFEASKKGIFLVDFVVTPLAVTANKAIYSYPALAPLTVSASTVTFTSSADSTGQTVTATSTGNLTFAGVPSGQDWLTVTKSLKVATIKVLANTNSEARSTILTMVADGKTALVTVTQAGA